MELLKFSDGPKTSRRGKNPAAFIGAGIMVAVMGLSSTLAGTITIGTGTVEFGQGVVETAACDSSITLTPTSSYSYSSNTFSVSQLDLEGIGTSSSSTDGPGCLGAVLELRAYNETGTLLEFINNDTNTTKALVIYIPSSASDVTSASNFARNTYDVSGVTIQSSKQAQPGLSLGGSNVAAATDQDTALFLQITGLSIPAEVTRITIESRSPRSAAGETT